MPRTRNKRPAAEVTAAETGSIAEPVQEPAEVVPDDLAATASELRQAAKDADEQAVRCRAEAEAVVSAARADADRILSEGHAKALPLITEATAAERKSTDLGGRSKHLEHAARQEALAEEHEAKAAELSAQLKRAAETIAGLDGKLNQLGEDRERLEAAVTAARDAGDASLIAEGRRLLDGTVEAMEALGEQCETAQARVHPGGDPQGDRFRGARGSPGDGRGPDPQIAGSQDAGGPQAARPAGSAGARRPALAATPPIQRTWSARRWRNWT